MSFIQTILNSNQSGFKKPLKGHGLQNIILHVKSERPKEFEKKKIGFFEKNIKSDEPKSFKAEDVDGEYEFEPKLFNTVMGEDAFKSLFGYDKRIEPFHELNPKYYEYNLETTSYNDIIKDTLSAENGEYLTSVEQREALKDFMRLKAEHDALTKEAEAEAEAKEEEEGLEMAIAEAKVDEKPRVKREKVKVEPVRNVFEEFEEKSYLPKINVNEKTGKITTSLKSDDIRDIIREAKDFVRGDIDDRSGVIKLNKLLKEYKLPLISGKEKDEMLVVKKIQAFDKKLKDLKQTRNNKKLAKETFAQLKENIRQSKIEKEKVLEEQAHKEEARRNKAGKKIKEFLLPKALGEERALERKAIQQEKGRRIKADLEQQQEQAQQANEELEQEEESITQSAQKREEVDRLQSSLRNPQEPENRQALINQGEFLEGLRGETEFTAENKEAINKLIIAMKNEGIKVARIQKNTNYAKRVKELVSIIDKKLNEPDPARKLLFRGSRSSSPSPQRSTSQSQTPKRVVRPAGGGRSGDADDDDI